MGMTFEMRISLKAKLMKCGIRLDYYKLELRFDMLWLCDRKEFVSKPFNEKVEIIFQAETKQILLKHRSFKELYMPF